LSGADAQSLELLSEVGRDNRPLTERTAPNNPSLILQANGHIRLETLSWIEMIRRKHLGDDATGNLGDNASALPKRPDMGRTASATKRAHDLLSREIVE
jgi:hypothetical protein